MPNTDSAELEKFNRDAHCWWSSEGEFAPLHRINPLRVEWMERHMAFSGKSVLDVGCGGGILSEALAQRGAKILGIDASEKALAAARLHAQTSGLEIDYRVASVEDMAVEISSAFDAIACMEMLEHVPTPESVVSACAKLLKPNGHFFLSTINRSFTAYLFAIVGAERLSGILPPGTHDFLRFIRPSELVRMTRKFRLATDDLTGFFYNPVTRTCGLRKSVEINYFLHARLLP
jgi:2-polyprenyl-6-hydroxyphenyl methylase/3-demethylubiquinone-9 3-methyltransferase